MASPEELAQSEEVKRWWLLNKKSEMNLEEEKAAMVELIGKDSGVDLCNGTKITYKKRKDTTEEEIDWEAMAKEIDVSDVDIKAATRSAVDWEAATRTSDKIQDIQPNEWVALLAKHTTTKIMRQGSRRFTVPHKKWGKEL